MHAPLRSKNHSYTHTPHVSVCALRITASSSVAKAKTGRGCFLRSRQTSCWSTNTCEIIILKWACISDGFTLQPRVRGSL